MSDRQIAKGSEPTAFGVFDPIGHVVLAFTTTTDCEQTRDALLTGGYDPADLVAYTGDDVLANTARTFPSRGVLSHLGGEREAAEQHQVLARSGHQFLVVYAPTEAESARVMTVARRGNVQLAHKYDRVSVSDLR